MNQPFASVDAVNFTAVARDCVAHRRNIVEEAGLKLDVDLANDPLWVNGDATRLCEIISNLLDNAVKLTPRGGSITVRLQRDDDRAVLAVIDDGIGIDPETLEHIFECPADGSLGETRRHELSIAKTLVELHGGTLSARSDGVGKGAIFEVTLPLVESLAAAANDMRVPNESPTRPLNIVVVEDNRESAESLRLLLRLYGHQVTVAHNGREGVAAVAAQKPDVMFCDIGLPDIDGFTVAREVRRVEAGKRTRLVAITGYGEAQDRQRALESGFDFHLIKPVDPDQLMSYFNAAL